MTAPPAARPKLGRVFDLVLANFAAVAGSFAFFALAELPDRYPVHWNIHGQPDRWASGGGEALVMPCIAAGVALLMVGIALALPRIPLDLWNIPRRDEFMSLGPKRQSPIVTYIVRYVLWLGLLQTLGMIVIQWGIYNSAWQKSNSPTIAVGIVVGVLYLGEMIAGIVVTRRRIIDAIDAQKKGTV